MPVTRVADQVRTAEDVLTIPATPVHSARMPFVGRINPDRVIFPYRQFDELEFDKLPPRRFKALRLENEFLQLTVLPELGGRLHRALFKPANYDLFYHNDAIRAQQISWRGAWYAGGVEFNFPISHSLITHAGIDCRFERYEDGSAAVLLANTDRSSWMRWRVAIRLVPGSNAIHFQTRLMNRTAWPQRYYYWLNAAVPQGPQIRYHFSASKLIGHLQEVDGVRTRVDTFPMLRNGSDARMPRALSDTTSVFMLDNHSGFFGYYDVDADLGFVRSAPVRNVPGNKIFSWGDTDYGRRFNQRLIAPGAQFYGELQSGRPESQTDWAIIEPFEVIEANESWYPIPKLGGMTDGGRDLAVLAEPAAGRVRLVSNRSFDKLAVRVEQERGGQARSSQVAAGAPAKRGQAHFSQTAAKNEPVPFLLAERTFAAVRPGEPFELAVPKTDQPIRLTATDSAGRTVFQYRDHSTQPQSIIAELYEHKADESTWRPRTAHEFIVQAAAAVRANDLATAEQFCRAAIKIEPKFGPARRWLGVLLRGHGRLEQASRHFKAALLSDPMDYLAYYMYAATLVELGRLDEAVLELERVIGYVHGQYRVWATVLLTRCLLRLGRPDDARRVMDEWPAEVAFGALGRLGYRLGLSPDPRSRWWNDAANLFEQVARAERPADELDTWWSGNAKALDEAADDYLEIAIEFLDCGDEARATAVLEWLTDHAELGAVCPAAHYRLGLLRGDLPAAVERAGRVTDRGRMAWTGRLADEPILMAVCQAAPDNALAFSLLGTLKLFLGQTESGVHAFERVTQLEPGDALSWRNLGLGRFSLGLPWPQCLEAYQRALAIWPDYAPLVVEADRMLAELRAPADVRRQLLWAGATPVVANGRALLRDPPLQGKLHPSLADAEDIAVRRGALLLSTGEYEAGIAELSRVEFHPGEGRFDTQRMFIRMNLRLGEQAAARGDWPAALNCFRRSLEYPENLGIGRPRRVRESQSRFLVAVAMEKLGDAAGAGRELEELLRLCPRNNPNEVYFGILALRKLGRSEQADQWVEELAAQTDARSTSSTEEGKHWAKVSAAMLARARGDLAASNRLLAELNPAPADDLTDFVNSKLY